MIIHNGEEITLEDLNRLDDEEYEKIKKPFDLRVSDVTVRSSMQVVKKQQEVVNEKQKELEFEVKRLETYKRQLDCLIISQNQYGKR